jgi:hypothetical protein
VFPRFLINEIKRQEGPDLTRFDVDFLQGPFSMCGMIAQRDRYGLGARLKLRITNAHLHEQ